jgi:hypothetical protein
MHLLRHSGALEEADNPSDITRYPDVKEGIRKGRLKFLTVYFLKGDSLTVWVGGGIFRKVDSQTVQSGGIHIGARTLLVLNFYMVWLYHSPNPVGEGLYIFPRSNYFYLSSLR